MKVLFGVNVLDSVGAPVYLSHMAALGRMGKKFPDATFTLYTPERCSIDRMRNEAARLALENEYDYLMFVDDDVIIEPNTFESLLAADADVVMAETYIRGNPFNAMWFKYDEHGKLQHDNDPKTEDNGLIKCDAVGFSCVLIKCSLLKKVSTPYFVTGPNFTEDIYFCMKAQMELGKDNVSIYCDTKVPTGHSMTTQFVHASNVKLWRAFQKQQLKDVQQPRGDRGEAYLKEIEALFDEPQLEIFK